MFELGDNELLEGKNSLPNTVLGTPRLPYHRVDTGMNAWTDGQMSKYMCICSRHSYQRNIYRITKTASKSSVYK